MNNKIILNLYVFSVCDITGKMTEVPDGQTPVNPKFRSGLLALTCYMAWPAYSDKDYFYIGHSMLVGDRTLFTLDTPCWYVTGLFLHLTLHAGRLKDSFYIGHSMLADDKTLFTLDTPGW